MANGPAGRITGPANLSYKRAALERLPDNGSFGTIEIFDVVTLRRDDEVFLLDDSHPVLHDQSIGFGPTTAIEFHNGRSIGGFARMRMGRRDWLRVAGFPVLPLYRSGRTFRVALTKRVPKATLAASLPFMIWLHYCAGAGELLGYAAGPGDSPRHLR